MPTQLAERTGSMRYPKGDLAILSAEVYDDGPAFAPSARIAPARKTQPSPSPRIAGEGPRKRARTQAVDTPEPDDKKRARGRPRLDTQDETAADRRRTQIRLAQRAYRNRKETAIQTLEKKVQHLKDTNEEMSNAFMQLHDFALSSGMLDRMPDFGRQLRKTTEKFLSLAREASDDESKEGESKEGEPKASNSSASDSRSSNTRSHSDSSEQTNSSATTADTTSPELAPDERPKQLWGGLTISHEPLSQADFLPAIPLTLASATASPLPSLIPPTSTTSYEVLTHPTLDNASFPFLPTSTTTTLPPSPSPYLSLPPPNTYAAHEATFGRRLQRYAMERSLLLFSLPNPPAALIRRVFGFCLLLESPAAIERRLRRVLGHDAQHSLSNWQFPFYHLGGAGRHFDGGSASSSSSGSGSSGGVGEDGTATPKETDSGGSLRMGNQGTVEFLKPAATAGFATGPFQADVTAVRDRELDGDMRMMLPGFGGEYFDCDEAELYLYQRGVVIPPGADVVTVEVDPGAFGGAGDAGSLSSSSPTGSVGSEEMAGGGAAAPWGTVGGGIDPGLGGVFAQGNPFMPATTMAGSSSGSSLDSAADGANLFSFGGLLPDGTGSSGYGLGTASHKTNRQKVVLDVMTLLRELCKRAICLGRTPGLKQADIDAAFWSAVERTQNIGRW